MSKLSEKIIEKINCDGICPKPRWHFLLKNYFVWLAFIASVTVGSVSLSVVLEMMTKGDWDVYGYSGKNFLEFCILVLPIFWIFLLILFAFVAYYNWKHTKQGYRYRTYYIFLISIGVSGAAGYFLFDLGMAKEVEAMMTKAVPMYHKSKHSAQQLIWYQPNRGLLTGEIVEIEENKSIVIKDQDGKEWEVEVTEEKWKDDCCRKEGHIVRIIGEKKKDSGEKEKFYAKEIRPDDDEFESGKKRESDDKGREIDDRKWDK